MNKLTTQKKKNESASSNPLQSFFDIHNNPLTRMNYLGKYQGRRDPEKIFSQELERNYKK